MPLYVCATPGSTLDGGQRLRIARALTRIHCELTGAPATFVHVVFDESKTAYSVFGTIRAGRTEDVKSALRQQMARAVTGLLFATPLLAIDASSSESTSASVDRRIAMSSFTTSAIGRLRCGADFAQAFSSKPASGVWSPRAMRVRR